MLVEISAQKHLLPPVILLAMLTIGMELKIVHFRELFRAWRVPIIGTLIHTLTFPLLTLTIILSAQFVRFPVTEATIIGLLLIAACPSGGFSNILTMMARGNLPLSVTLTSVSAILTFISLPVLITIFGFIVTELQGPVSIPFVSTLVQLAILIFFPVLLGMFLSERIHWLTDERVKMLQGRAQLALYIVVALVVAESWEAVRTGFWKALPWAMGLWMGNVAVCFSLARAARFSGANAVTVCLEGSVRNVTIAMLIAANTLERPDIAVTPIAYFLFATVASMVFAKNWRRLPGFAAAAINRYE